MGVTSQLEPRDRPPILYRLALDLNRRGIRGSWRLVELLKSLGMLRRPVDFVLGGSVRILVPIERTVWDDFDLSHYEAELFGAVKEFASQLPAPVTLIDGGADIGLFSLKMLTLCPGIKRVIAFEPNPDGFEWLQRNLARLDPPGEAIPKALSDFEGMGTLEAPSAEIQAIAGFAADHTAYFLVPSAQGTIPVMTVDGLKLPSGGNLLLKLDVEGGERAALRGAERTIREAARIVVVMEAHPLVTRRTGIDPVECLRLLASLRRFSFVAGETGQPVDTSKPLFDQIAPTQIYNLIAYES